MNANPRVVACVPAFRAGRSIERTLGSLADQTYRNLRVVVSVDDAEADGETAGVCASFARQDPRFTVVRQPRRLGWVRNANAALRHLQADQFTLIGHDDVVRPTYVERLSQALLARKGAVLAFSDIEERTADGVTTLVRYGLLEGISDPVARSRRLNRQGDGWWVPFRGIFPSSAVRKFGGLRRHLAGEFEADWPFLLNLALLGEFVRVPEPLYVKHLHDHSLSRSWHYSRANRLGVTLASAAVVARAELPASERLALLRPLANSAQTLLRSGARVRVARLRHP